MTGAVLDRAAVARVVEEALREDLGEAGDVTTAAIVDRAAEASARLEARERLIVAGLTVARAVFERLDPGVRFEARAQDGAEVEAGEVLAIVRGRATALLEGERTALNFLMRMSGVATATRSAVREVEGTRARILDTRKTMPGLRALDKYAVAVGGGTNHRFGLYDAVMIKDTHVGVAGSVGGAVRRALRAGHPRERVTAEADTSEQLVEALDAGAGRVLLDNMTPAELRECVRIAAGRAVLEASGGLRPGRLREFAETGVDFLSLGWLTHSARAADVAMEIEPTAGRGAGPP